ncbi:hypothetical protein ASG73_15000 [Janibacter sp. Soil728]|uniref:hypothetical protein n=1 Tax=Janibacter sp. Soil728 TaxID=1736393 RepID=UPI0006FCB843|nr:hypothetical protein [Janibacter sp. Soil728]KRE35972.1 hypothetical protein ASG73_15000 [Janibacter sp. Soil728]
MQPSSLIFVLVVAIWAVYLLQYWIKRRDHLSTVRSVDRFSAAMRVLDDHRLRRDTAEPTPRSYSVTPARAARPEVTVKHAEAPIRARKVEPGVGAGRRLRGLTLLTMLVMAPVVGLVAAFGPLPWWVAAAWLVGTVAAFGWLRQAVRVERATRGRERVVQRRAAQSTAARSERVERVETAAPSPAPRRRAERIYDVATTAPAAEVLVDDAPLEARPLEPGTWEPTPVPRPMYTMKARAGRPEPMPQASAPAAVDPEVPQVIDVEDEDLPAIAGWG